MVGRLKVWGLAWTGKSVRSALPRLPSGIQRAPFGKVMTWNTLRRNVYAICDVLAWNMNIYIFTQRWWHGKCMDEIYIATWQKFTDMNFLSPVMTSCVTSHHFSWCRACLERISSTSPDMKRSWKLFKVHGYKKDPGKYWNFMDI